VLATLATPFTVCAKNSLVRPSPRGAQVDNHAWAFPNELLLTSEPSWEMSDAEDDDLVRRGSAGGGTSVGVDCRGVLEFDRGGVGAIDPNRRGCGECAELGPGDVIPVYESVGVDVRCRLNTKR